MHVHYSQFNWTISFARLCFLSAAASRSKLDDSLKDTLQSSDALTCWHRTTLCFCSTASGVPMWLIGKRQNQYISRNRGLCASANAGASHLPHSLLDNCLLIFGLSKSNTCSSIERYFLFALYMSYLVQEYEDTSWHVRVCILLALIPYRSIHCS